MFGGVYQGRRVLVTGHSGFKGSWLCAWLAQLGATVRGVALPPESTPNHVALLHTEMESVWCDLRDAENLDRAVREFHPEILFHLAAQPLVRRSYRDPAETFSVNVGGTVNLLESVRNCGSLRSVVIVTSDKCYRNDERQAGYREEEPLGGRDPYSASKGCQEIVAASFRDSFLSASGILLATARAGNVIGGGDWAEDRLIPDLVRAAERGEVEPLRSPDAVRPWQHVLEPLSGYLELGRRLFAGDAACADAWNFGPAESEAVTVGEAAANMKRFWDRVEYRFAPPPGAPHEAKLLRLDCGKAERGLGWHGVWNVEETFRRTAGWYRDYYETGRIGTMADLDAYTSDALRKGLAWTRTN